jgi:hypothetical protein
MSPQHSPEDHNHQKTCFSIQNKEQIDHSEFWHGTLYYHLLTVQDLQQNFIHARNIRGKIKCSLFILHWLGFMRGTAHCVPCQVCVTHVSLAFDARTPSTCTLEYHSHGSLPNTTDDMLRCQHSTSFSELRTNICNALFAGGCFPDCFNTCSHLRYFSVWTENLFNDKIFFRYVHCIFVTT